MNLNVLIDSIVRQTTVLIAQLAVAGGSRPSLAHTANQVFIDLVDELRQQGVRNRVIADMFGLALRTYHEKVQRLRESRTSAGRSVWEAIFQYLQERGTAAQAEVLLRFRRDDDATVRGVLGDLVSSGLVYRTGRGASTKYRVAPADEAPSAAGTEARNSRASFVWVAINRLGHATTEDILAMVPMEPGQLDDALELLVEQGRVTRDANTEVATYTTEVCLIPMGDANGWEAAVLDHYQALVTAICTKLRLGGANADANGRVGGSTYSYWVWRGHPLEAEVYGLLAEVRQRAALLRERVAAYNTDHDHPEPERTRVLFYLGQTVLDPGEEREG